jgi:hypothetical protein
MNDIETTSWFFISKTWLTVMRMPIPDKGFEDTFRDFLCKKVNLDIVSDKRELKFGLSYSSLSGNDHELDFICVKELDFNIFELKNYEVSDITKEIIFTFLGKVLDFYLKNIEILSKFKITMFLVTTKQNVDDSIRRLCITYGIKLIEPTYQTPHVIDYWLRDIYSKLPNEDQELKISIEQLLISLTSFMAEYDYSFSDIFRYDEKRITLEHPIPDFNSVLILNEIKEFNSSFQRVYEIWKLK